MTTTDVALRRGMELVHANGIDIACTTVGDGPPLVLLHGGMVSTGPAWAGSSVAHVDHVATLGQHFRVVAPDTRGSGATVHPGGSATFEVLADDVIALIEALELDRPCIAGFSEGGATATLVALRRPDLVRALVNHSGFDYFEAPSEVAAGVRQFFGGSTDATQVDPDAAQRAFQAMPRMAATFATMQADYADAQGADHWRTYLGQFFDRHVAPVGATLSDLAALSVPTLVLTGDQDMFCSVEAACATYRKLPSAELAVLPGTGHDITTAVVRTMIDYCSRQASAG